MMSRDFSAQWPFPILVTDDLTGAELAHVTDWNAGSILFDRVDAVCDAPTAPVDAAYLADLAAAPYPYRPVGRHVVHVPSKRTVRLEEFDTRERARRVALALNALGGL